MKPSNMRRDVCVRFYCTESEARDIERMSKDIEHNGTVSGECHDIALKAVKEWKKHKSIEQFELFN